MIFSTGRLMARVHSLLNSYCSSFDAEARRISLFRRTQFKEETIKCDRCLVYDVHNDIQELPT